MSKEKGKTQNKKRKLTRQEKKQIDALIRQSKGDGKPHTAQDSIPFERMYKDGICRLANGRYSKCIEFEDINYQLAQPDDKTAIFEALCDMYNSSYSTTKIASSSVATYTPVVDDKGAITYKKSGSDSQTSYREGDYGKGRDWYMELALNYNRKFGNHSVTGLFLYNQSKRYYPGGTYDYIPTGYVGLVGRVTYDWKTRYLAEFNVGYNGSENFSG